MTAHDVPVVRGSLLLGSARALQRDQLATYEHARATYGDIARFRIGPPGIGFVFDAVFHPDGARDILTGRHYTKQAPVFTELRRMVGNSILTYDGEPWRKSRRLLQPLFTRQRIASLVDDVAGVAAALADSWEPAAAADRPVDLYAASMRYALDALGVTVFGKDMGAAGPTIRSALPVIRDHVARRGLAAVRIPASIPTPANRRAERARVAFTDLVDELLASRRGATDQDDDLLGRLLQARDPDTGAGLDDASLRAETLAFLVAGEEATASALAFALQLLGRHPEVQDRVRAEVGSAVPGRTVRSADLAALPYTTAVVDETLRLYPAVHTLPRRAGADAEVMGHAIPEGRIVAVSVYGTHRNPAIWAQPDRFDPDRFGEEAATHRERYAHLAFGAGPRTCIGVHLAMAELVVGVATLVRSYRLHALAEAPTVGAGVTLHPVGGLPCRLERLAGPALSP